MKKSFKGFTLIELIVVIAIIGVLASILVPAMMGWVRKASINSANSNAKSIFTNAQTIAQEDETNGSAVPSAQITGAIASGAASGSGATFVERVNACMTSSSHNATWAVSFTGYIAQAAVYSNNGSTFMGGYPRSCPADIRAAWDADTGLKCASSGSWKES